MCVCVCAWVCVCVCVCVRACVRQLVGLFKINCLWCDPVLRSDLHVRCDNVLGWPLLGPYVVET